MPLPPSLTSDAITLDLLAIMSDAPDDMHRGAAAMLLARELVARMDLSPWDYRGPQPGRLQYADVDSALAPMLIQEGGPPRPLRLEALLDMRHVAYPRGGPRAALRYLRPQYGGAVFRGGPVAPRFNVPLAEQDAAILRSLVVALMGSDAFAESRATFEQMMSGAITSGDWTRINLRGGAYPEGTTRDGEPVDPRFGLELRNLPLSGGYAIERGKVLRVPAPGSYRVQVDGLARAPQSTDVSTEIVIEIAGVTSTTHTFSRAGQSDVWFAAAEPTDTVIEVSDAIEIRNVSEVLPSRFALLGALLRVSPVGPPVPTALDGLTGWWRSTPESITMSSQLWRSTASLPIATLSGTPAAEPIGLWIEVTSTGARGVAAFRYSADHGKTWIAQDVPTAASVPLAGPLAGMSVAFPDDDYVLGHYARLVDSWGSAFETNFASLFAANPSAGAPTPATYLADALPGIGVPYFGGTNSVRSCLASSFSRKIKTIFCVARRDDPIFTLPASLVSQLPEASPWSPWRVLAGNSVFEPAGGIVPAGTFWKDGVQTQDVGAGAVHIYARTLEAANTTTITLGNTSPFDFETGVSPWGGPIFELIHFDRDLTSAEWNYILAGLGARYGVPVTRR